MGHSWEATMSAMRAVMRALRPLVCHERRKPRCTEGRPPHSTLPRLGGWATCHACANPQQPKSTSPRLIQRYVCACSPLAGQDRRARAQVSPSILRHM